MQKKNPWTTLSQKTVYDNPWIKITHNDVLTPNCTPGIYGKVHFKNLAIGIVPIDEKGNTWLVGQYRYTLDQYSWEIPEGGCPLGSDPLETAKRELKEETGILASHWECIQTVHLSNSVTDEYGMVFLAQNLSFGEPEPEDSENLQIRKLPFDEAIHMVSNGEITDALSIISLLKVERLLKEDRYV
ncbi:MAG: NUDIX hydrolase [Saprospiraceae bacterium]|nr:NUDIX hydrolase [Saprospiraceae bacterium]